ncbi:MAG: SDR family NAD(P)-dependent oxidoreductase [Coxiellaceae bacterium]|nr:SDR family NAD(P)-dependent oxidoreductase [Coxiellaceae bacterium]MDF1865534.1 SDR family NAD(P)-dependent oxidoreductase [Saprospiraceae bacterium]
MDLKLAGHTVMVSGSSKGIGLGIGKVLLSEGCNVVLNGRSLNELKSIKAILNTDNVDFVAGDVTDQAQVNDIFDKAVNKYGSVDHLICNVGSGSSVPPCTESIGDIRAMLDINFISSFNLIQQYVGYKKKLNDTKKSSITCISSICGLEYVPGAPAGYAASKAALSAYVKSITPALADMNIRINLIAPGNVIFSGSTWEKKLADDKSGVEKMLLSDVPLKRFAVPEEIGSLAAFLCSSKSSFTTGAVFVVDGGQTRLW